MKQNIHQSEQSLSEVTRHNSELRLESSTLKDQLNQIKNSHIDLEQDFNRMTIETYNVLYNIRHKFE